jgi:hypothetical protein
MIRRWDVVSDPEAFVGRADICTGIAVLRPTTRAGFLRLETKASGTFFSNNGETTMISISDMNTNQLHTGEYELGALLSKMDEHALLERLNVGSLASVREELRERLVLGDADEYRLGFQRLNDTGKVVFASLPLAEAVAVLTDPAQNPEHAIERKFAAERERRTAAIEQPARAEAEWLALSPVARAAHRLAGEASSPEIAQLLQAFALAVATETTQPSAPPSAWLGA